MEDATCMRVPYALSTRSDGGRRPAGTRQRHSRGFDFAPLLWMIVLTAFVVGTGMLPTVEDRVPSGQTATISVRVSQSDTLWSIASSHRIPGMSTSRMVELIARANALNDGGIRAGAVLLIPTEGTAPISYAEATNPPAVR